MTDITLEQIELYQVFGNYAIENWFWDILYINNAMFNTPLKNEIKNKLLTLHKKYSTILRSVYPSESIDALVQSMAEMNRLFILYVQKLLEKAAGAGSIKEQWDKCGEKIATILAEINPHWRLLEWNAMISHSIDLLDAIALSIKDRNYPIFISTSPICKQLAVDMSSYMASGIIKDKNL